MSPAVWAATFGTACIVAATVISLACLRAFAREDAAVDRSLPGDLAPRPVEPQPDWRLFDAPEFREALREYVAAVDAAILAAFAEVAAAEAAELDDDDAVAAWLGDAS